MKSGWGLLIDLLESWAGIKLALERWARRCWDALKREGRERFDGCETGKKPESSPRTHQMKSRMLLS